MRHQHPKIYGEVCNLHPELNGERYGNKLHPCVGCQKDYLKKWRDENRKVIFGAICQKHPELEGKRKYKMCVACDREKAKERLRLHPGRAAAYTAKWQKNNQDKVKTYAKEYYAKNKERRCENSKKWKEANKERAYANERKSRLKNWDTYIARIMNQNAMRRGLQKKQKLSASYKKEMAAFYRNTPEGHHVDHIIPVKGGGVCGLHVPWNLQYLPKIENLKKGNTYQRDWEPCAA